MVQPREGDFRANAALIVRAVNAHAGMVEALKELRALSAADFGTVKHNMMLDRARAALALAEKEN